MGTRIISLLTVLVWPAEFLAAQTPDPSPITTLRFVSWKPDHPQVWREAIAQFSRTHPHIRIAREIAPHSSTAYHDLLTQKLKNKDRTIDMFFMDVIWIPEFATAGWARPLNEAFSQTDRDRFLRPPFRPVRTRIRSMEFPAGLMAACCTIGKTCLRPMGFSRHGPGTTWSRKQRKFLPANDRPIPLFKAIQLNSNNMKGSCVICWNSSAEMEVGSSARTVAGHSFTMQTVWLHSSF